MAQGQMHTTMHAAHGGQVKFSNGINVLLGLWLIISPWVFAYSTVSRLLADSLIVGVVVAVLAAISFFNTDEYRWMTWVNLILGLWILASPWIFAATAMMAVLWNFVIVGILIAALAIWSLAAAGSTA